MLGKKQKILLFILFSLFVIIAICVNCGIMQNIDNSVYALIKNIQNNTVTKILTIITNLGGIPTLFFIALFLSVIFFICKKRKWGIAVLLNLLMSSTIYIVLKNIFQRPRPEAVEQLISETGHSFPSGHTTNNVAFYGFAIYLIYENIKNKKLRNILFLLLGIMPILIGFSRIYLRVHYFSDVLAGIIVGSISVTLFISIVYNKIR